MTSGDDQGKDVASGEAGRQQTSHNQAGNGFWWEGSRPKTGALIISALLGLVFAFAAKEFVLTGPTATRITAGVSAFASLAAVVASMGVGDVFSNLGGKEHPKKFKRKTRTVVALIAWGLACFAITMAVPIGGA